MCLLSGGIDSPVAAWRMMRRGCRVLFVHFHSYPVLSRASQEKARELVANLTRFQYSSTLMLVLGVAAGIVLALLSRVFISIGASSRARKAERRLRAAVAEVAEELVIAPVVDELAAYRQTWEGLRTARG